jgi:hypothetical protein
MVFAEPSVPIPWGLLHDSHVENDPYRGFWAPRYKVAAVYNGVTPLRLRSARPRENVKLLSGLDEVTFGEMLLKLDKATQTYINRFLRQPVGPAFTTQGCRERWRDAESKDCIIHYFGHARDNELRFSEVDRLDPSMFRRIFGRESSVVRARAQPVYALSILNGCETVAGHGAKGFLIPTADPGFCGFIGPEAVVPDQFAFLFGQELLYLLLVEALSVREAMGRLWRKHDPMSLFYGCYAHPAFRVGKDNDYPPLPRCFTPRNYHPFHEATD